MTGSVTKPLFKVRLFFLFLFPNLMIIQVDVGNYEAQVSLHDIEGEELACVVVPYSLSAMDATGAVSNQTPLRASEEESTLNGGESEKEQLQQQILLLAA
jgi:hypothetical protein